MKNLLILIFCLMAAGTARAQIVNPADDAKNGATDHVNTNVSNTVDNGLNNTENAVKGLFKKKKKPAAQTTQAAAAGQPVTTAASSTGTIADYKNYDFAPGEKIIFQSDLADEHAGEIPSQLVVENGQMDIQLMDGENTIHVPQGPGVTMHPRMTNNSYLPDQFTIEFDFKNEKFGINHFSVDFGQRTYYSQDASIMQGMAFNGNDITWMLGDVKYPDGVQAGEDNSMKWHHIAIAVNKNVGKVYIDQYRVASVNNLSGKPKNITIDVQGYENSYIKNVRVASGGIDIYKEATTDAKIVTHGILFDVDKATIKPESMGTINTILGVLQKNPSLKYEIDGHTDNTGNSPHNLTLSQQRADAVKAQLVSMGIDASRLSTKGFGDSKPIADNTTPEGKANNRRVEFIKI